MPRKGLVMQPYMKSQLMQVEGVMVQNKKVLEQYDPRACAVEDCALILTPAFSQLILEGETFRWPPVSKIDLIVANTF